MASQGAKRKERDVDTSSSDVDEISATDVHQPPSKKMRLTSEKPVEQPETLKKPENYGWWIEALNYSLQTGDFKRKVEGFNGESATKKEYLEFQEHVAMQMKPATVLFNQVDQKRPFISEFCRDPSKEKSTLLVWLKSIKDRISVTDGECETMVSRVAAFWSEKRLDLNDFITDHLWSLPQAARDKFNDPKFGTEADEIVSDIAVKFVVTGGRKSKLKNFKLDGIQTLGAPELLTAFIKCRAEFACQFGDKAVARKKIGDDMAVHGHIKSSINVDKIGQDPPSSAKPKPKKGKKKAADNGKGKQMQVDEGADAAKSCLENNNNTNQVGVGSGRSAQAKAASRSGTVTVVLRSESTLDEV